MPVPAIASLDHLVFTVADLDATLAFYRRDPDGNLIEISDPA